NSRRCRASVVNTFAGRPPVAIPRIRTMPRFSQPMSAGLPGSIRGPPAAVRPCTTPPTARHHRTFADSCGHKAASRARLVVARLEPGLLLAVLARLEQRPQKVERQREDDRR